MSNSSSSALRQPLAERVGRAFAPRACVLGYGIFVRGGVAEVSTKGGTASFEVGATGKRRRTVTVRGGRGTLEVACTCAPDAAPLPCRHVWAAVLEIDRRGVDLGIDAGALRLAPLAAEPVAAPTKRERAPRKARAAAPAR